MLFKRITSIRLVPIIMSILLAALLVFAITPILSESVHATPQNGGTRSGQLKNLTLKSDGIGGVVARGYSGVAGTKVSLYAEPGDGYRFLKWEILSGEGSIDNPGSASTIFTFGATDTVVQAVFIEAEQNETYVVVSYDIKQGTATATVDPNDPTTFHLTATSAAGCSFIDWNCPDGTGTIQDRFHSTATITNCSGRVEVFANFHGSPTCPVTATANPTAGGTAEASWNDVRASLDVDLKATPSVGYVFKEWRIKSGTGAIRNPNEAFTVLTGITGNVSCEAVFEAVSSGQNGVSLTKNKPEGGEATASVTSGSSGTTVVLTAAPASGFRFEKWEVSAGGVTIDNPSSRTATFSIGSENVIVKAVFAEAGHSVTVTSEGGGKANASNSKQMPGLPVDLYAYNATGFHFSHWEIVSGNITLANPYNATTSFIMGNEAVEVKAVFVPEDTYCVRITNDGNGKGSPSAPSGAQNETVTLTATPNPGYKFKEWIVIAKNAGTLSSTTTNPAQFTIGIGHATFRATFAEEYAIKYHLDGGTNDASNPATYTQYETITLANPTRNGHTFGGWYDNAAFNGSPVTEIPAGSSGDKQFFAKWTADIYNISYQNLKGASNSNPVTYTITDTPIPLVSPTGATGYTFDGWYDNASFSGNAITEIPANSTGDKMFYAKWTADIYNISYQNVNGASNSNPATYTIADTPLTLVPLAGGPTGHTFDGWYDNASFSGSPITAIPAGITGDRTFYAKWTAVKYDVSVSASPSNGGTVTGGGTYADGDDVTVKASANMGYTFKHWTENGSVVSSNATYEFKATAARNLVAIFEATPTPTHVHKYGAWTKLNATQHQKVCQYDKSHVVKENHKWDAGKVTKKASAKATGVRTYTCTVCKAKMTKTIPKLKPAVSGTPLAKATVKKNSLTIGWNKIQGAEGYDIFFATCNHSGKKIACKNVKTIKGNKAFKWTKSGLKKGTAYKFYVRAYVTKNGKKTYVSKTPMFHAYTGNGTKNYTNAKSVSVNKTKVALKKGKTFKIKAKVNKVKKNKKLMPKSHAPTLRYMTSNSKIASVNSGGKIIAKGKGTCYIYVYAHNGVSKQIKVTVK